MCSGVWKNVDAFVGVKEKCGSCVYWLVWKILFMCSLVCMDENQCGSCVRWRVWKICGSCVRWCVLRNKCCPCFCWRVWKQTGVLVGAKGTQTHADDVFVGICVESHVFDVVVGVNGKTGCDSCVCWCVWTS